MIKVLFVLLIWMDDYRGGGFSQEFYKEADCQIAASVIKKNSSSSYVKAICVRKELP
jgi:hypothetical protein